MTRKERAFVYFLITVIGILILLLVANMVQARTPPEDIPQPPEGCVLADYIEWPEPPLAWGGWANAPYQVCGVATRNGEVWHSLFIEDCSNLSDNGWANCDVRFEDGTRLVTKSKLSDSGARIEGFDVSGPNLMAGVYYIPVQGQAQAVYSTFVPAVVRDWGCRPGCMLPPWPP